MVPRDAAGGIIIGPEGKIVLVWQNGNSWSFPKGGIEQGETTLEAAWREVEEETGLAGPELVFLDNLGAYMRRSIAPNGIDEDTTRPESTRTLYLFKTTKKELDPQDREVTEARFVTIDEALMLLTHPKDKAFLESKREKIEEVMVK